MVIGIDVGTAITGWGVVEIDTIQKSKYKVHGYGVIRTEAKFPMHIRLEQIHDELSALIKEFKPTHMAIEDLFFFKNQKTVIKVGQARGVIMLTGTQAGLELFDYTPLQVKQAVSGYGRADKKQVQKMVQMILNLKELPKPDDAADALAVAICHLNTVRV
ncbi:crossover junction endodeoxyribonuclease RuvC [Candidatus Dojkabacteria bacterium]|uniref:Crossover junction endodeoxyribonuclease RuvC n=1 Tax=Candidatus Dojkabacteria bacterium TaxID=2099670 RepID=A0A955L7D1_9BACT|nr:crossover junction endodeoxyribonuclease RuvC [Candidatus Dojkabacteria bacterium]